MSVEHSASILSHKLYSGSVKDVYGLPGEGPYVFKFSDRYSIFDWGEMPDSFAGKGEALAVMGDLLFRHLGRADTWLEWAIPETYPKFWRDSLTSAHLWSELRRNGLRHHSLGLVNEDMSAVPEGGRSRLLAVQALPRPAVRSEVRSGKLIWEYSEYAVRPAPALVPLEVVFRFGAPEGSSFLERLENRPGYAESFGFAEKPAAGDWFPYPVVEFFTKLEPTDRFLTREEALEIAALTPEELDELVATSLLVALRLKDIFASTGLELWDGKFEFGFTPPAKAAGARGFQLVDSIGPDELRLVGPGGVHFSKEFLRRVYRGGSWYRAAEFAKRLAKERGVKDWKAICREELKESPRPLPPETLKSATALYPALADALSHQFFGRPVFGDQPTVKELCREMGQAEGHA
jgi:phosphoribosylaminoimidazole-succinocarboxamide synthase